MTKKAHILFLVLTFGFFMMSNASYACGKSAEKNLCEKKMNPAKDSCQKECCKETHNSKKDEHGCSGKCNHSGCTTSGLQFSLITENQFDINSELFHFSFKKPIMYYKNSSISDGFTSIWAPPKIK